MRRAALAMLFTIVAPIDARAQPLDSLQPETRIRVRLVNRAPALAIGSLVTVSPERLTLYLARRDSALVVSRSSIATVERSLGRRGNGAGGFFLGAVLGAGAGALIGTAIPCTGECPRRFPEAAMGVLLGLIGGGVGFVLGRREEWEPVPLTVAGAGDPSHPPSGRATPDSYSEARRPTRRAPESSSPGRPVRHLSTNEPQTRSRR